MFSVFLAITIAWVGVTGVLVAAPYIQKLVGKRGMAALEQVMGMILGLISMGMIVRGAMEFVATLK
jgi:multiple antibiotic resistance protein